jgi:glycosyltransferase involved in cell wall biosynthesis
VSWGPSDLVVLVPMLGRPHHVGPLLESLDATVPDARVLFLVTPGDDEVIAAIDAAGRERLAVKRNPIGDYARKINIGYRSASEQLIFTGASDLRFHDGWFEAAVAHLAPGIGVVGTNDRGNPLVIAGQHATHFLVTRRYADEQGVIDWPRAIFCELYHHEFVDNELIGTAKYRGAYAMALDSLVEHRHPHWCPDVPSDPLYERQAYRMNQGRKIFTRRQHLWGA